MYSTDRVVSADTPLASRYDEMFVRRKVPLMRISKGIGLSFGVDKSSLTRVERARRLSSKES